MAVEAFKNRSNQTPDNVGMMYKRITTIISMILWLTIATIAFL